MKLNKYILQWEEHMVCLKKAAITAPSERWIKDNFDQLSEVLRLGPSYGKWTIAENIEAKDGPDDEQYENAVKLRKELQEHPFTEIGHLFMTLFDDYFDALEQDPSLTKDYQHVIAITHVPRVEWSYTPSLRDFRYERIEDYLDQLMKKREILISEIDYPGCRVKAVSFPRGRA